MDPGDQRMYFGDSQTAGRWTVGTNTRNHATAFEAIWDNKYPGNSVSIYVDGVSGRDFPNTALAYEDRDSGTPNNTTATMVWVQESGNQDFTGQSTPAAYKASVIAFWQGVHARTPNALKVHETAYSFGRTGFPRDWTEWNTALREAVAELALEGIIVIIVETDAAIKALCLLIDPTEVWFEEGHPSNNEYHYRGLGNAAVAVAGYKAFRIPLTLADLVGLDDVSEAEAQLLLDVSEELP